MPLFSPLVKCAVILLGKKIKIANMPSSSWAAKIMLHNLGEIKTILLVKIKSLFPCIASSVCIRLGFHIMYLDCQCFGTGTVRSVSVWGALLRGS